MTIFWLISLVVSSSLVIGSHADEESDVLDMINSYMKDWCVLDPDVEMYYTEDILVKGAGLNIKGKDEAHRDILMLREMGYQCKEEHHFLSVEINENIAIAVMALKELNLVKEKVHHAVGHAVQEMLSAESDIDRKLMIANVTVEAVKVADGIWKIQSLVGPDRPDIVN